MPGAGVTGLQGQDAVTQQLMGVMQGTQQMPGLDALQRNISREQDQQRRQQAEQMALRGVGNSTINDTAMNDLAARQADEMTTRMTGAQAQLLSNYTGNLGALQQGNLNQQGQAFGQGMATRQQGANESIQDFQARLAGQGQQYGQGLANRQQGSNEALQQYQALMGGQGQSFNQALQGRQQGAAEEAQRYQQLSGTRGQSLNEFFGFSDRQQQMDAQLYNQQLGALQLGLGAMGNVNTGGGQMQTVPQSGSAAGSIAGAMTQTAPYWMPGLFDGGGGGTSNDVKQPAGANVW